MKKDDMKKPYKEGKAGLKIVLNKTGIILICFFISKEILPQIPINGFCQFNSFSTVKGLTSIFSLNFNNDSYSDLIFFSPDKKNIVSEAGQKNGGFSKSGEYRLPYQISSIKGMNEKDKQVKRYAFISRQNMRAGIYSFTSGGRAYITNSIKLNSYPANLSLSDINKDGSNEFLLSGPSFNGLSIIYHAGDALKEKKVVNNTCFSEAVFADLSNDGYPDIAAFDITKNSLDFFYNQSQFNFKQVRVIKFDHPIASLHAVDFNLDGYPDLIFTEGSAINIMYGDFASTYNAKVSIPTKYYPDKIITGDFNRDGKIDIAYLNISQGIISVIYGKNDGGFYPEIIYMKKDGLQDIIPYYSKFINGIASISSAGNIYTIRNLLSFAENVNISIGAAPRAISGFDEGNNGINDICYIDSMETRLNLIVRNTEGIPSTFYSYPVYENYSNIIVDNFDPNLKTFYCYSHGKRLIEILKIDFKQNKIEQSAIYSPGEIDDLKIQRTAGSYDNIYIAFTKQYQLGLSIMEYKDYRYSETNYFNLSDNVLSANITEFGGPGVVFWKRTGSGAELYKTALLNNSSVSNKIFKFSGGQVTSVISLAGDIFNNDKEASFSFLQSDDKNFIAVTNFKSSYLISGKSIKDFKMAYGNSRVILAELRANGLKKIYLYTPGNSSVDRIDLINKGREAAYMNISGAENLDSFMIQKMSSRYYHLIYTDKNNNCITIRQL